MNLSKKSLPKNLPVRKVDCDNCSILSDITLPLLEQRPEGMPFGFPFVHDLSRNRQFAPNVLNRVVGRIERTCSRIAGVDQVGTTCRVCARSYTRLLSVAPPTVSPLPSQPAR